MWPFNVYNIWSNHCSENVFSAGGAGKKKNSACTRLATRYIDKKRCIAAQLNYTSACADSWKSIVHIQLLTEQV